MSGRLVWVPQGGTFYLSTSQHPGIRQEGARDAFNQPLPAPTVADIDALVTEALILGTYADAYRRVGGETIGEVQSSVVRETIKAALRELLGIKL